MMVPQVIDTIGAKFSHQQIAEALRLTNYDVDKTIVSLLEKAKTSSAARMNPSTSKLVNDDVVVLVPVVADAVLLLCLLVQVETCRCKSRSHAWKRSLYRSVTSPSLLLFL